MEALMMDMTKAMAAVAAASWNVAQSGEIISATDREEKEEEREDMITHSCRAAGQAGGWPRNPENQEVVAALCPFVRHFLLTQQMLFLDRTRRSSSMYVPNETLRLETGCVHLCACLFRYCTYILLRLKCCSKNLYCTFTKGNTFLFSCLI